MAPPVLSLDQFKALDVDHVIDVREPLAWASGHFPGALCLPVGMIPAFAGWFVGEGESIALVGSDQSQIGTAMEHLVRIALDNVVGGYVGIVPAAAQGRDMARVPTVVTQEVEARLNAGKAGWKLLDVRDADEREQAAIEGSEHIYVGELGEKWRDLDKDTHYTVMCASGMRASVAAGLLASKGFEKLDIYLGSMGAWKAAHG